MRGTFYITTTLPYVNAAPHIGFALEIVQADALARYRRLAGDRVFFNTGTDEHGAKVFRKAVEEKKDPQVYVTENAEHFKRLMHALGVSEHAFIRTTDPHHVAAAQEFWRRCAAAGDIYKRNYPVKYCVGCELEKTDSELEDGRCPIHPTLAVEAREEENYFFAFSRHQRSLFSLYARYPDFVVPAHRLTEIRNFVSGGLQDFSISRLKEKMPWGVPVPDDENHVMYVWFDALVNYVSTLGWPENEKRFADFWGTAREPNAVQIAGKDNLRQQSAMWQAMLLSAGLPPSRQIMIHGFITSGGAKMSKSVGNVVDPFALVARYGADAVRYWLLREVLPFEDGDFTEEKFRDAYNANLANGIGNLTARIMKLAEDHLPAPVEVSAEPFQKTFTEAIGSFRFNLAMDYVWERIHALDDRIATEEPFRVVKSDPQKGKTLIAELVVGLSGVARLLAPFLPETSEKIGAAVQKNKKPGALFTRIS